LEWLAKTTKIRVRAFTEDIFLILDAIKLNYEPTETYSVYFGCAFDDDSWLSEG
jgi:hypothetical protein